MTESRQGVRQSIMRRLVYLLLRLLGYIVVFILCALIALAIWGYSAQGKRVALPDWAKSRIAGLISQQLPEFNVNFRELSLVVPQDMSLNLLVEDVGVRDLSGNEVIEVASFGGTLSLQALLEGVLQPTQVHVSGADVVLRREMDGSVTLSGNRIGRARPSSNFVEFLENLDVVFNRPNLARLKTVEADNLALRYEDVRVGRAWSADGGIIRLTRKGQVLDLIANVSLLGDRAYATEVEASYSGRLDGPIAEFGFRLVDMPSNELVGQSPALDWLTIIGAPLSGAFRGSITEDGQLGPLNAALTIGQGEIKPAQSVKPLAFRQVSTYFSFNPQSLDMTIKEISFDSDWVRLSGDGRAQLNEQSGAGLSGMVAQMQLENIEIKEPNLFPDHLKIDRARLSSKIALDPLEIEIGTASLETQGQTFVASGLLSAGQEGWEIGVEARTAQLRPATLMDMWPEQVKPKLRDWISTNIKAGKMHDVYAAVTRAPGEKPNIALGFGFEDLVLTHVRGMPPIEGGSGQASLIHNRFAVLAHKGRVTPERGGPTEIAGTSFVIPDTTIKEGPAEVRLKTSGSVTSALSLIDGAPFHFLKKAGRSPSIATGQADVDGVIKLRLRKVIPKDEITVTIDATARDVRSDELVEGRVLTADRLKIALADQWLSISGNTKISGEPISVDWRGDLRKEAGGRSELKADLILSQSLLNEFRIGLPKGMVSGAGPARLHLDLRKNAPARFDLTSNLKGVGLRIPEIGWSLTQTQTAQLNVKGTLGKPPDVDLLTLRAPGLSLSGKVNMRADGQLDKVALSEVAIADWFKGAVDLIGRGAGVAPSVSIRGGSLDLRKSRLGGSSQGAGSAQGNKNSAPVSVALDRLQVTDKIWVGGLRSELTTKGGAAGNFIGKLNGKAPISGRISPSNGRSAVYVTSKNAGAVAASIGIVQDARAGDMELSLDPARAKGTYNGKLQIRAVSIRGAPALAAIINSLSIVGLINELTGDGIYFDEVRAKFQLSPDRVVITKSSAVGNSMGISMDGYYYPKRQLIDLQGVFSPVYMLNRVGSIFTRRGEGLIGFNYSLSGPVKQPNVHVNPLSVFTPGMFREIFRRAPPEVSR